MSIQPVRLERDVADYHVNQVIPVDFSDVDLPASDLQHIAVFGASRSGGRRDPRPVPDADREEIRRCRS